MLGNILESQQQLTFLIDDYLEKVRWYFLINNLIKFLPLLIIVTYIIFVISSLLSNSDNLPYIFSSFVFGCLLFFKFLSLKRSIKFRSINRDNYLAHCNRHFESLEESAHLVLINSQDLNVLQRLQQSKTCNELLGLLNTHELDKNLRNKQILIGKFQSQLSIVYSLLLCSGLWLYSPLSVFEKVGWNVESSLSNTTIPPLNLTFDESSNVSLIASQLKVLPPKYTSLPSTIQKDLNVELLAGSEITWQLEFSDTNQSYFIEFANGEINQLILSENNLFTLNYVIEHTGLYKLYSQDKSFQQIHTLRVALDKKPIIKIITPKDTVTEIEKKGESSVISQVNISDDYQISHVEILASIAKGSGESVKFRDQVFAFDTITELTSTKASQHQALYEKKWDFASLNMEPGDELYFTVKAWDNKQPLAQLTSSETKIIRWLEDEEQMVMADGILIDFMPEYFKSQRQIIIETKELIVDKEQLDEDIFIETSELLGVAQSQLKQKYGQYLGDEFDDGGAVHVPNMSDESPDEHHDDEHNDDQNENHQLAKSNAVSGHDHGVAGQTELEHSSDDKSGYSQLIETYAHNHEDTDIGMMSRQDPKALMKQSIANMWQAELYLMLSQPKKALPFEEQALTLLKMAKKAERIYVKRLGFEPPPVSEQRRYQGDLSDILSESKQRNTELTETEQHRIAKLYRLIKQHNLQVSHGDMTTLKGENTLLPSQRIIIQSVKELLQNQLNERPALIHDVATLERIVLADSMVIDECYNCVEKLKNRLWQLLDQPTGLPNIRKVNFLFDDSLMDKYNSHLLDSTAYETKSITKEINR
jgi:hypothetical protein